MFHLEIENLRLTFRNASGHEHRVAPIAERAMALLAQRVEERWRSSAATRPQQAHGLDPSPLSLDLGATGDEQAAGLIADLCLEALALKL